MVYTHDSAFRISIKKLALRKLDGGKEIEFYGPDTSAIGDALISLTITESILDSSITGSMVVKEPSHLIDKFVLTGQDEIFHIEMETPGIPNSKKKLELCVTEGHRVDDVADIATVIEARIERGYYKISFCSCESLYYNVDVLGQEQNAEFMNKDRFLKISIDSEKKTDDEEAATPSDEEVDEEVKTGLVNTLAPKYFNGGKWKIANPMDIEGTHNSVWLKANQNLYPWGKDSNNPNLMQLMETLAENSIDTNQIHANFLFWNDFDGWHFKSIAKMIKENKNEILKSSEISYDLSKEYVYAPLKFVVGKKDWVDKKGDPKIMFFAGNLEQDHMGLWNSGSYSSYYDLIKPNYGDPYFNYLDSSSSIKSKLIEYSYQDFWTEPDNCKWETIETYKILPSKIKTSIDKESPNKSREIKKNEIYGYFGNIFNNSNSIKYDFISSRINDGKFGKRNSVMWQTMLDQTNLKISKLENIYKNIIGPTKENYEEFLRLKNLKEKWNVYRHSICCDAQDVKSQFFAVIDDAILVSDDGGEANSGGIYEYTWREVELWPSDAVNGFETDDGEEPEILTDGEAPITVVVVPNGLKGTAMETNGAWNLNELMNTKENNDVYVGPGVNVADDDFNDYPEAYQMMPVGGYFKVGYNPCADDHENKIHFHKHIVQMHKIPSYMLEFIVSSDTEDNEEGDEGTKPEEIYFFDVPNAHDGLCDCIE